MLSVIIDYPILDALCLRLNPTARALWWYLVINAEKLPIDYKTAIAETKMHTHVFYRAVNELELYGMVLKTRRRGLGQLDMPLGGFDSRTRSEETKEEYLQETNGNYKRKKDKKEFFESKKALPGVYGQYNDMEGISL